MFEQIDIKAVVGFLTGSLATLIIKELINQYNKRQDFQREVNKLMFQKKLEKGEKAIAFHWLYLNKLIEIKKAYEVIILSVKEMEEKDTDIPIVVELIKKSSQILAELSSEKYLEVHSVHLYFDLVDKDTWSESDIGDLIRKIAEIKSIDNSILFWMDLYNKHMDSDEAKAELYWGKATELLSKYSTELQGIIDLFEKNKTASELVIQKIKNQIKEI